MKGAASERVNGTRSNPKQGSDLLLLFLHSMLHDMGLRRAVERTTTYQTNGPNFLFCDDAKRLHVETFRLLQASLQNSNRLGRFVVRNAGPSNKSKKQTCQFLSELRPPNNVTTIAQIVRRGYLGFLFSRVTIRSRQRLPLFLMQAHITVEREEKIVHG